MARDERPAAPEGLETGLVLSHLGQGLAVEAADGRLVLCHPRRRLETVAVGDQVLWSPQPGATGRIETILPRHSLLTRPAHGGRVRPVAANLDQIVVVVAPEPVPDWLLVDQYLAACEHRGLRAVIAVNKIDQAADRTAIVTALEVYRRVGYPGLLVSARTGEGLDELRARLAEARSLLAGQSGVGKSSLTNALVPDRQVRTRELSARAGLGRHTTTAALLHHLPDGGELIDSPGVAVFGLAGMNAVDLAAGYREFREWLGHCRFNDCRHLADHGCAIREAVTDRRIDADRYERFRKLLRKMHLA